MSAILYKDGVQTFWYMCLFVCLSNCKCLFCEPGWKRRPGENYKKIRFLLVLDKICMGKKGIKRIDLQNNAQAEPEGTLHTLRLKNIHLCCFCKPQSCKWGQFLINYKSLLFYLCPTHHIHGQCSWCLKAPKLLWNQRITPVCDSQYDKWLIMVISWIEHLAFLCNQANCSQKDWRFLVIWLR